MKKKRLSVVVATALMASLVVGMGAMTYSKYITSTSTGTQQATAANWGFVITADASKLFGNSYTGTNGDPAKIVANNNGVSIKADLTNDANRLVVAPGSTGYMTISINGTAEVRAKLSLKQKAEEEGVYSFSEIGITSVSYYPIIWTLKNGDEIVDLNGDVAGTGNETTLDNILTGLETTTFIEANTTYSKNYTLSWVWPLETGTTAQDKKTNNAYDTIIGYKSFYPNTVTDEQWADITAALDKDVSFATALTKANFEGADISTKISFAFDVSIEQVQ